MNVSIQRPLDGVRVVEFAGLGPAPFAAMLLADLGADVVRIERPGRFDVVGSPELDPFVDEKRIVRLDLKDVSDRITATELIARADVLIEGYRPGVLERLGLGPDDCLTRNPSLVYARVTGWPSGTPGAELPGHDINFLADLGILDMIGTAGQPIPPLNLVADFGGAGMALVTGILARLYTVSRTGGGVLESSLLEGAGYLAAMLCGQLADDAIGARGGNLLDGGAPFYRAYRCQDERWLAVGAIEPKFWVNFLDGIGLPHLAELQLDRQRWPVTGARIAARIAELSSTRWRERFDGVEACVTVCRTFEEAVRDTPHLFYKSGGHSRPSRPVRFAGQPADAIGPGTECIAAQVLSSWNADRGAYAREK
ncbi:CaiB/BaiF CoA-transferase family protein [Nocardia sp. BMG51109]|uniref:CaiB/BaiF CoA transferase family protein n=1 Tax=Nocardia sp. BMG51109 TaxID=1056816 RepID=UPI000465C3B4|nr:CaiB/BaiF CoA-transferase family protein [Nocardia sp. BMG51109]